MAGGRFRALRSSEWAIAIVLGYVALATLPPLLMLVVIGAKFQGLRDVLALDHAQLARHLAAGEGFVTSFVRPLSLVFKADIRHHPDLYNAPFHPLLLSLVFRAFAPGDRVAAGVGAALWVLSVWLTFLVARRALGGGAAALATLFYGCNVAAISAATGGLPHPLAAVALLLAFWLAAPPAPPREALEDDDDLVYMEDPAEAPADRAVLEDDEQPPPEAPLWRVALAGAASGLAVLTHYSLAAAAVAVGLYLVLGAERRGRALGAFLLGLLAVMLPWFARNAMTVGSPFFTLSGYEALTGTDIYPGGTVWRVATPPDHPVVYVFQHPLQMMRKLLTGLAEFRAQSPVVLDPVLGFLFFAGLLHPAVDSAWRRLFIAAAGSMALFVLWTCVLEPDPRWLVAWAPLVSIGAAQGLRAWLGDAVAALEDMERWTAAQGTRIGGTLVAIGAVAVPLAYYVLVARPGPDAAVGARVAAVQPMVKSDATVMTDQPALLAWYGQRRALWLPQREEDLTLLEKFTGPVDAAWITPAALQVPPEERGTWWFWLTTPQSSYHGLALAPSMPPGAMLWLRKK